MAKYQNLNAVLKYWREKENTLLGEFTTNNEHVQTAQTKRKAAEEDVRKFEAENRGVTAPQRAETASPGLPLALAPPADPNIALREAQARLHAKVARYQELTNQMAQIGLRALALEGAEYKITQAQAKKEVAELKYKNILLAKGQAELSDTLGNKVSNITTIEQPRIPGRDVKTPFKVAEGVLAFFLVLAFGLPFLIEFVLDRSFRDALHVQATMAQPFFIAMPRTNGHGPLAALKRAKAVGLLPANGVETPGAASEAQKDPAPANGEVAPWDERHELRPYFESLRDRVMTYFEMINLTHKPKLLAVTSCAGGAGVTTTAAGLASSLSETGDGNVLLVNMNVLEGEAHHFYKGKANCGIEDALGQDKRERAQVHGNLFVAKEAEPNDNLPRVLPKRFSHLVPMMKASDYDYIIFDMPPVSEISITPRLARFMDMVLLVIEAEKTSRDTALRVASLLAESKTNVGLVLNKNRSYLPKRLEQRI